MMMALGVVNGLVGDLRLDCSLGCRGNCSRMCFGVEVEFQVLLMAAHHKMRMRPHY